MVQTTLQATRECSNGLVTTSCHLTDRCCADRPSTTSTSSPVRYFDASSICRAVRLANPENITVAVNQPGVHLIDTSESKGVEQITEKGLLHEGVEYEVDCIM